MSVNLPETKNKRIVIIGGGFGGINLARKLHSSNAQVVLIDRNNFHTFQPLLYQVATAGLEPGSIAYPLRKVLGKKPNYFFRMTEVTKIDPALNTVYTSIGSITYDYLVIASGTKNNYFNMQDVREHAMPLKSVSEATGMRNFILENFEKILLTDDEVEKERLLTYVIAGGGPTGVELSGALSELKQKVLPADYPELDLKQMKIILVDAAPKLLTAFSEEASAKAKQYLEQFGVEVRLNTGVKSFDGQTIMFSDGSNIATRNLIWAAGVIGDLPDGFLPAIIARGNRLKVNEYNLVEGFNNIFAIGDIAYFTSKAFPNGLPGLAPVAIQQGAHVGKNLSRLISNKPMLPFKYTDKGSLATIGRNKAVADLTKTIHFQGFFAWLVWLVVHLFYLIGFRNKVVVVMDWFWNYISFDRRARLILKPFIHKDINEKQ
jgi:NADH:ubiquinone reductase (H+-translocating)